MYSRSWQRCNGEKEHGEDLRKTHFLLSSPDYLRNGYFKDPKGHNWAFGIAAVEREDIRKLSILPGLSDDPSAVRLLRVEEQQSSREQRLTVDYHGLNEVTPPLSAAMPDIFELQYELQSKAAQWYVTIDIANAFFSIPLAAECRPQFAFTWREEPNDAIKDISRVVQTASRSPLPRRTAETFSTLDLQRETTSVYKTLLRQNHVLWAMLADARLCYTAFNVVIIERYFFLVKTFLAPDVGSTVQKYENLATLHSE
ncbi:hypothetical protein RLOC_00011868 [Lonchura striata]|uniref:Reverse transcriptase domain-containing protein n=1 Tax=Lonchura striata TaxID=40157 RepID=A0A218VDX0_9PASE|nr:hypothetical protein RLOC_00011868 [Lonchura striata domestica]